MKLLGYDVCSEVRLLTEEVNTKDGKKETQPFIEGVFAQAEKENRNGRIYPRDVLRKAIDTYGKDYMLNGRAWGELNHPDSAAVNPDRICILMTSYKWEGNDLYGKAKVLTDLPCGKIVEGLMKSGGVIGVSTRGAGSIDEAKSREVDYVADDYQIFAIDVVTNPSGIDCWVKGINESVEYFMEEGKLVAKPYMKKQADILTRNMKCEDFIALKRNFAKFLREVEKNL